MFTGFATENTPAIQVWECSQPVETGAVRQAIALQDDCAPLQYFKTGGSSNSAYLRVYLPTAPVEGKQITLFNARYGSSDQKLYVYASDVNNTGSNAILYVLGAGQSVSLVYTKNSISIGGAGAGFGTGWVSVNQSGSGARSAHSVCFGYDNQAVSTYSAVLGGSSNRAINTYCAVVGGSGNTASQIYASVVGGLSNTANGNYAAVVGGAFNQAVADSSVVVGGASSTASGNNSAIVGGTGHNATNTYSIVLGGDSHSAAGASSAVVGGTYGSTRSIIGKLVFPASQNPIVTLGGTSQTGLLVLGRETTSATTTRLTSNNSATGTTANQVILPSNSAFYFAGTVIANVTGGGDTSAWKFEGAIKRGASAATTALVAAVTPTVIAQDAGAAAWAVTVTADTINGGLKVEVTGAAATTIRWVCKIETTEVTF